MVLGNIVLLFEVFTVLPLLRLFFSFFSSSHINRSRSTHSFSSIRLVNSLISSFTIFLGFRSCALIDASKRLTLDWFIQFFNFNFRLSLDTTRELSNNTKTLKWNNKWSIFDVCLIIWLDCFCLFFFRVRVFSSSFFLLSPLPFLSKIDKERSEKHFKHPTFHF